MSKHGDFILLETDDREPEVIQRLSFGDTSGRNEAWLQKALLAHPELLPIQDIDPAYGPLVPLCVELNCDVGRIDIAFVNPAGRLTLVECKLWRNPEARREVVAQTLDYASTINQWSYSDLQRQVCRATKKEGNVPFELVKTMHPDTDETEFVDAVSRNLREGRFLLVVAGDGIREGVEKITGLVQRNAAMGLSFALVEVALYGLKDNRLLLQPRTIARTHVIERPFVLLESAQASDENVPTGLAEAVRVAPGAPTPDSGESEAQAEYRRWWQPVIDADLDDPEQEPASLFWQNHIRAQLPWPGAWILCYRYKDMVGVSTAGRSGSDQEMLRRLLPDMDHILEELPSGSAHQQKQGSDGTTIQCSRKMSEFASEEEQREWFKVALNDFVNALRHRVARLSVNP